MRKIKVTSETLPTMGGVVKYFTTPCPYLMHDIMQADKVAAVGGVTCRICLHNAGTVQEDSSEIVNCNHS